MEKEGGCAPQGEGVTDYDLGLFFSTGDRFNSLCEQRRNPAITILACALCAVGLRFQSCDPLHDFPPDVEVDRLDRVATQFFEIRRQRVRDWFAERDLHPRRAWETRPAWQRVIRAEDTHGNDGNVRFGRDH